MRISDWSSDVCSSDLFGCARWFLPVAGLPGLRFAFSARAQGPRARREQDSVWTASPSKPRGLCPRGPPASSRSVAEGDRLLAGGVGRRPTPAGSRSEEHTSELQSLMRISYAVFCLKKKKKRISSHKQNTY